MLHITIKVDAPAWAAQGVKEWLAMYCEKFGDTQVVEIREEKPQQTTMYGGNGK